MRRDTVVGIVLVVVSACAFGSGALFAKPVYAAGVGWHVLMAWRFLIGTSLAWLGAALNPAARASLRRIDRRTVVVTLTLGAMYTGNTATFYAGLETVSASLAALIVYLYPALVAVLSLRVGQRLEGRRAWAALVVATTGVVLAVGNVEDSSAAMPGLALTIAAPIIYAAWIVLAARLSGEARTTTGRASEAGLNPIAAGALMLTATTAVYWTSALALGRPVLPGQVPPEAWGGIVGVGVVSLFVAFQAFYAGAHRIGAARASLVSTVEPLWTIGLAALLFAERLAPLQLVGGAMIIGGVLLAQTAGSRASDTELPLAHE
jgi:drug/metabolite transporter (DMT)-like permease